MIKRGNVKNGYAGMCQYAFNETVYPIFILLSDITNNNLC